MGIRRVLSVLCTVIISLGMFFQTITAHADSSTGVTTNWENNTLTISYASSDYEYDKNKVRIMMGTGQGQIKAIDASDSTFEPYFPDNADASGYAEIAIPWKAGNLSVLESAYEPYGSLSLENDTFVDVLYLNDDGSMNSLDNYSFRPVSEEPSSEGKDVPGVGFEAALSGRNATIYIYYNSDSDQTAYVSAAKDSEHKLGITVNQGKASQEIAEYKFGEDDQEKGAAVLQFSLPDSFRADSSFTAALTAYGYKTKTVDYNAGGQGQDQMFPSVAVSAESKVIDGTNKIVLFIGFKSDVEEEAAYANAVENGFSIGLMQADTQFDVISSGEIGFDQNEGAKTITFDAPEGFDMAAAFRGGFKVNGYMPKPFNGSPASDLTVTPLSLDFGTLDEGYDAAEVPAKQISLKNTGSEAMTVQLSVKNAYVFDLSAESLTIPAGETKTVSVSVGPDQPRGNYQSSIDVQVGTQTVKSVSLQLQVINTASSDACKIVPDNSEKTTKFIMTCTDSTISDFDNEDGFMFEFTNSEEYVGQDVEVSIIDAQTLVITKESIIENSLYLNGTYNVKLDVFKRVSSTHEVINLTTDAPITCNTTDIVHDERANVTVIADEKGIHFKGMSDAYLDQAIATADGTSGRNKCDFDMDRGISPNNTKFSVTQGVDGKPFIQKEYDSEGNLIGGIIPTEVLVNESIEAGGYQRLYFHVPGYTNILLETRNKDENVIDIKIGAENLGNFVMTQNLTAGSPDEFSITFSVPQDEEPERKAKKWTALKSLKEFKWASSTSALSSWGFNTDLIVWDEATYSGTISFDTANSFYGMLDHPGINDFDVFTFVMPGYAPSNVVGTDGKIVSIINPLEDAPERLRTLVLGTKVRIESSSARYLETFDSLNFSARENEETPGTDFSIDRGMKPFTWSAVTKQGNIFYIEFTITEKQLKEMTSAPDGEFIVNIENRYFRSVWSSMRENFNAVHYVAQSQEIAGMENPDPQDLAEIDDAALDTNFKHVDFTGGVTNKVDDTVDINGTIAGAITEEDTDLYQNEVIDINTSITEMTEEDKKEIMDYLNGHHLGEIKHAVDIKVLKTYPGEQPQVLSVLGVNSAIVFSDLPELKEGYEYIVITKHNGQIKLIPVTYKNGKLIAYTKEFSSFAISSRPIDPVTPSSDDAVSPEKKAEEKTEANTASQSEKKANKKSSGIVKDTVVTCQMAGYPAGYAWNESAKACQPGFLDNAGVFHGTAVRKAGVPNTYDKGLKGSFFSLMASIIVGISAAYALRKY